MSYTPGIHRAPPIAACLAIAALLIAAPTASAAGAAKGNAGGRWYGSASLGWNYADPLELKATGGVIDFDFGLPAASLAVGVQTSDHWRLELEASYQKNPPEVLYFPGTEIEFDTSAKDRLVVTSLMVDAYRDFSIGTAFRPYLGLGIGPAWTTLRYSALETPDGEPTRLIDDKSLTFAYQAIAGVTVPLSRRIALGIEYRYWRAPSLGVEDLAGNDINSSHVIHSGWFRLNYRPGGFPGNPARIPAPAASGAPGFYLAGGAGIGWGPDQDLRGRSGQLDAFAIGPMGSIAAGYQLGRRWRIELEAARRRNDMQIFDILTEEFRTTGDVRADSLTLNVVHRFRPGAAVNPYLGAGLGTAKIRYHLDLAADREPFARDTDTSTVVQLQLGFDVAVSPRWTVTMDFRAWNSDDVAFDTVAGERLKTGHMIVSMGAGLRYSFGR